MKMTTPTWVFGVMHNTIVGLGAHGRPPFNQSETPLASQTTKRLSHHVRRTFFQRPRIPRAFRLLTRASPRFISRRLVPTTNRRRFAPRGERQSRGPSKLRRRQATGFRAQRVRRIRSQRTKRHPNPKRKAGQDRLTISIKMRKSTSQILT
jgi:hypothetical protein